VRGLGGLLLLVFWLLRFLALTCAVLVRWR
jgi:hypothetical protein